MGSYYDGHYKDTDYTLEELDKKIAEEEEISSKLTEWPKDTD